MNNRRKLIFASSAAWARQNSERKGISGRLLLAVLGTIGFLAAPLTAEAQSAKSHRIAFLSPATSSSMAPRVEAFRQGLREFGYIEGQNITIEYRWAEGRDERLTGLAAELARLQISIAVTHGVQATLAARKASTTIPIVCFACGDLVATGVVASLARPGGNITGLTVLAPEVSGKRLELLKEIVPGLARMAVLFNPDNPVSAPELKETETAARSLGLQLQSLIVKDPNGFASAFSAMNKEPAKALIVLSDAMFYGRRKEIADLAISNRLPAISHLEEFADAGLLLTYGPDVFSIARRAATYVDKILKGTKSADLPIEQPTKFELIVNVKTAKALGIKIPDSILVRADKVIK